MVILLLHGSAGGWDELAIAAAALAVLWIAVKLAGRKPARDEDADDLDDVASDEPPATMDLERSDPAQQSPTRPI